MLEMFADEEMLTDENHLRMSCSLQGFQVFVEATVIYSVDGLIACEFLAVLSFRG